MSAVNYHTKLVTPDHKIAIKISYLIEIYFLLFLYYWDQRHPISIRHYTSLWHYRIWHFTEPDFSPDIGFHRASAMGVACQQGTLTPPDTWSCPTLGLACVLMSRPISPELVLSPDLWISNTPRYFSFALYMFVNKKIPQIWH